MNDLAAIPPPPSKWDIIPIHTSDREAFKSCRRKWAWSSPAHANLIRKPSIYGIIMPLWFGTGIHQSLERYYNPILSEDPVFSFESWFSLEVDGGLVPQSKLKEYPDRSPKLRTDLFDEGDEPVYYVSGLKEILPDYDPVIFDEHRELGIGMLSFYKDYAARNDNFRVVAVEHDFSVPILNPDSGEPLYMVDRRRMPEGWEPDTKLENVYGPLMMDEGGKYVVKQVHARGRQDMILQDNESGRYGIKDYKTAGSIGDDYFRHLDLDEQCTSYLWAAEREAQMYDLPYDSVDFIIYEALRKVYPKPPSVLKDGITPSVDRQKESCTAQMFEKHIKDNNLDIWFEHNEKAQSYYNYLLDMGDKLFIQRGAPGQPYVFRNHAQKLNAGKRLYQEALDMLDPNLSLYPNPTKNYSCLNCTFRAPCVAKEAGHDWESMLEDGFIENYDR
jgi:hypothetical protein